MHILPRTNSTNRPWPLALDTLRALVFALAPPPPCLAFSPSLGNWAFSIRSLRLITINVRINRLFLLLFCLGFGVRRVSRPSTNRASYFTHATTSALQLRFIPTAPLVTCYLSFSERLSLQPAPFISMTFQNTLSTPHIQFLLPLSIAQAVKRSGYYLRGSVSLSFLAYCPPAS